MPLATRSYIASNDDSLDLTVALNAITFATFDLKRHMLLMPAFLVS